MISDVMMTILASPLIDVAIIAIVIIIVTYHKSLHIHTQRKFFDVNNYNNFMLLLKSITNVLEYKAI